MAIDTKKYGTVYKHITETVDANYGKFTLPWKFDQTKSTMLKAATEEYKADNTYPIRLHEALSDIVLRWCFDGYPQTTKEDIRQIFMMLWQFHKKWMLKAEEMKTSEILRLMNAEAESTISGMCTGINNDFEYRKHKIQDLFVAVMTLVADMAKDDPE